MPISEIATAAAASVPAINSALNLIERVSKLVKATSNLETQEAVLELRSALLAVKEENLTLKQDNLIVREELGSLKRLADTDSRVEFEAPNYYLKEADGKKSGPYCQTCFDKDHKLIRLKIREEGLWRCNICNTNHESDSHREKVSAMMRRQQAQDNANEFTWLQR